MADNNESKPLPTARQLAVLSALRRNDDLHLQMLERLAPAHDARGDLRHLAKPMRCVAPPWDQDVCGSIELTRSDDGRRMSLTATMASSVPSSARDRQLTFPFIEEPPQLVLPLVKST